MPSSSPTRACAVCGRSFPERQLIAGAAVREGVAALIRHDHADWTLSSFVCREDLSRYSAAFVEALLASERGELTALDQEVLDSLRSHELLSTTLARDEDARPSAVGERLADQIAAFGGSWTFMIGFAVFIAGWIVANAVVLYARPPDPYPFILLNLVLSCLASVQAPIIMMSQNRQEAKDRIRSEHDYQINLKAELEIRHLHEKLDHLLSHQWARLVEIQQVQLELLGQLQRR